MRCLSFVLRLSGISRMGVPAGQIQKYDSSNAPVFVYGKRPWSRCTRSYGIVGVAAEQALDLGSLSLREEGSADAPCPGAFLTR
jgi:hypothetical protein